MTYKKNSLGFVVALWILFSFNINLYSQEYNSLHHEQIYQGLEANNLVSGADIVRLYDYTAIPAYVRYRTRSISESNHLHWLERLIRQEKSSLKLIRKETDELGYTHYRYIQTYSGYEIFGTGYIVHCKDGYVQSVNGLMYDRLAFNEKKIDEKSALNKAIQYIGAKVYKWEIPSEEEQARHDYAVDKIRKTPSYYPTATLKLIPNKGKFYAKDRDMKLCYVFDIYAHEPMDRKEVFVDVSTGDIVYDHSLIMHGNANGTAMTAYSGTRAIVTDSVRVDSFRLREVGRGSGIQTLNLKKGTSYAAAVEFRDSNNIWNNTNANLDQYATDAHWGSEMTYDYFWNIHGRNSIDNAGFLLKSYIHYSTNYTNAFWNGSYMTYGDGASPYTPLVTMEIAGHEISHGLTSNTSNLIYSYESGALNESFSDIFGVAIDFYARPTLANWLMGDGIGGTPFRNMSNPNQYGDPDTYLGTNWYTGTGDNGGVHTNSGVQNYWFYLLTNGGVGKNDKNDSFWVTRLGIDTAGKIAFRNNTFYLIPSSQYADARFYAIQSAIDLYGACTQAVISTTNAWHAVGVGSRFDSSVRADFLATTPIQCPAPQTIRFTNLSTNASSFKWYFGTGDSSTATNPSYRYTANGRFHITLVANGGNCGSHTITKTNYIFLDPHNDCITVMGDTNVTNACNGILYDNGGPLANYSTDHSDTLRISPTGASAIAFNFLDFDVEAGGSTCIYDYVQLHNGTSVAATSLGKYCNSAALPSTTISSGASATVRMLSDPAVTGRGFELKWQCTVPNSKPNIRFSANTVNTCTGLVNFKDESYNTPTTWKWSFGDGGTSTAQHPSYQYNTSGLYSVTLIASNAFGSDTFTKLNYISVNRVTIPSISNVKKCGNGSVTLTATGSGTIQWFDSLSSTSMLSSGSSYITPSLSASRSYYLQSMVVNPPYSVGAIDTTIGTGSYQTNLTNSGYTYFDVSRPCKLLSVKVKANSTRNRRIRLLTKSGVVLRDTIINIASGVQTVSLGFDLPMASDLRLEIHKDSIPYLYKNTTGANYPYTDTSGLVTIKGNNLQLRGAYYYFYNWIVQEDPCTSPRKEVQIKIQNPITLKNLDTFNCNGGSIVLTPSGNDIDSIYWTTGGIAASSRTVSPSTTTNYIYSAFNVCGEYKDTTTIQSFPIPTLIASNDTTICSGDSILLKAKSNITPSWNTGVYDTMIKVSPTSTTYYTVQASNACGILRDTISVAVINKPQVIAQNDTTICKHANLILTASSSLPITWYPANSNGSSFSVLATQDSIVYAQVSNVCGVRRDTVRLFVDDSLSLALNNDTTLCQGISILLKAKTNGSILWTSLSLTDSTVLVSPSSSTIYPVVSTNSCGSLRDTISVSIISIPMVTTNNDTSICIGDSISLYASSLQTITWTPGNIVGTNVKVSPISNTTYHASVSNSCGSHSDSIRIAVVQKPTLTHSRDTAICTGRPVILSAQSNSSILWTSLGLNTNSVSLNPTVSASYPILASNACGMVIDTIKVKVDTMPRVTTDKDTTICIGNSLLINAYSSEKITWQLQGIQSSSLNVTPSQSSSYIALVNNSCGTHRDTIQVTVIQKPTMSKSKDTTICKGTMANLWAISSGNILWTDFNSSTNSIKVSPMTTTTYKVQSSNNCGVTKDSIKVSLSPSPIASMSKTINGNTVKFVNTSQNASSFLWVFGDGSTSTNSSPSHLYSAPKSYNGMLIASNICGRDTLKFTVQINNSSIVSSVNSNIHIYPNPAKDKLTIDYPLSSKEIKLEVYDISGKKIMDEFHRNKTSIELDLSHLSNGDYILKSFIDHQVDIQKISILK